MRLLFLSLRLIRARSQPSAHESVMTKIEIISHSTSPPAIPPAVIPVTARYTITAGTIAVDEYMRPIRYTVSSLEAMIVRTGIGSDSMRSLSLAMYSVE